MRARGSGRPCGLPVTATAEMAAGAEREVGGEKEGERVEGASSMRLEELEYGRSSGYRRVVYLKESGSDIQRGQQGQSKLCCKKRCAIIRRCVESSK
eukprot:781419-Pleurochrysis_carterae.AAC.2